MPETTAETKKPHSPFTIKTLLVPFLTRPRVAQIVKWSVYTLLTINFIIYFRDDFLMYQASAPDDAPWWEFIEFFATTIDVASWLALVYIFELETYILPDEAFKGPLPVILKSIRGLCYLLIIYAAYGYTAATLDNYKTAEVPALTDLCMLADKGEFLQVSAIDFIEITSGNCTEISAGPPFHHISDDISVIDGPALDHVQKISLLDISNAFTWLIIILLIEFEVWLQATDRFGSRMLQLTRQIKTGLYGVLFLNAAIWLATSYPLYAYDQSLWIIGFWAIELNLAEWEQDRLKELSGA